jgi:hypothetical protein
LSETRPCTTSSWAWIQVVPLVKSDPILRVKPVGIETGLKTDVVLFSHGFNLLEKGMIIRTDGSILKSLISGWRLIDSRRKNKLIGLYDMVVDIRKASG